MANDRWRPLSVRHSENPDAHDALHEGVPPWLSPALMTWVQAYFLGSEKQPSEANVRLVEITLRHGLGDPFGSDARMAHMNLRYMMKNNSTLFLDVLDFALAEDEGPSAAADALEHMLRTGGSAWSVAPDKRGLTRRVAPEIQAAVEAESQQAGRPGEFLTKAWHYVYGRNPNPSEGYHMAVKAIEAAAIPVVTPNDRSATLGRVIGELRAQRAKFKSVFVLSPEGVDVALNLADVVWRSHHDRHGTPDEAAPISVSAEEAEGAVHAALLLVHWLRVGTVQRA